jgi:hypothetical protein
MARSTPISSRSSDIRSMRESTNQLPDHHANVRVSTTRSLTNRRFSRQCNGQRCRLIVARSYHNTAFSMCAFHSSSCGNICDAIPLRLLISYKSIWLHFWLPGNVAALIWLLQSNVNLNDYRQRKRREHITVLHDNHTPTSFRRWCFANSSITHPTSRSMFCFESYAAIIRWIASHSGDDSNTISMNGL